jgi:Sec-independent protein secretion pathway component TatC
MWKFVAPGLYSREKKIVLPFVIVSSLLFVMGSTGAYTYVFPAGFSFFLKFAAGGKTEINEAGIIFIADQNKTAKKKNTKKGQQHLFAGRS